MTSSLSFARLVGWGSTILLRRHRNLRLLHSLTRARQVRSDGTRTEVETCTYHHRHSHLLHRRRNGLLPLRHDLRRVHHRHNELKTSRQQSAKWHHPNRKTEELTASTATASHCHLFELRRNDSLGLA